MSGFDLDVDEDEYPLLARQTLSALMSYLSEDCYCAGWLHGCEFDLWDIACGGQAERWGAGEVSKADALALMSLSHLAGGWIVWNEGRKFVTHAEWHDLLSAELSLRAGREGRG